MSLVLIFELDGQLVTGQAPSKLTKKLTVEQVIADFEKNHSRGRETFAIGLVEELPNGPAGSIIAETITSNNNEPLASDIKVDPDYKAELHPVGGAVFWAQLSFALQSSIRKAGEAGDETIQTFREYMNMAGAVINYESVRTRAAVYYLAGLAEGVEGVNISSALLNKDQADTWLSGLDVT